MLLNLIKSIGGIFDESHFPVSALSVSGSEGVISACLSFYFRKKGTPIESRDKDIIFFIMFVKNNCDEDIDFKRT